MTYQNDGDVSKSIIKKLKGVPEILQRRFDKELGDYGHSLGVSRDDSIKIGNKGNSVAQGNRARSGKLVEDAILDEFDNIVPGAVVLRQWLVPGYKDKPLDGFIETKTDAWGISIAASTRERKEGTWNNEYRILSDYADECGKTAHLIAITNDEKNAEALRGRLDKRITLIWAKQHDQLRPVITALRRSIGEKCEFLISSPVLADSPSVSKKQECEQLPLWK